MWRASSLSPDRLSLLPPAKAAARAAFKSSVKAAWLVHPRDPFEREARSLAHLRTEEDYLNRQMKQIKLLDAETSCLKYLLTKFGRTIRPTYERI